MALTKPKPKPKPTPEARLRAARKIAREAIARAEEVAANPGLQRSTRTRAAYKVKALALHRMLAAIDGKRE